MSKSQSIDFSGLKTYSIHDRFSKVTVENFAKPLGPGASIKDLLESLPGQFAGVEFPEFIDRLATSHKSGKSIAVGMGAHVIKVGLNPVIIDLMERKVITSIALNGAGIVHDTEVAMVGRTSVII
jgi:deoxyhypusine synthase